MKKAYLFPFLSSVFRESFRAVGLNMVSGVGAPVSRAKRMLSPLILAWRVSRSPDAKTGVGENNNSNKNKSAILRAFIGA